MNLLSRSAKHEFRTAWLPHISDLALGRLAVSLETHDPRLLHDDFGHSDGGGCLEVQCMMYHPGRLELERQYPMFTEMDRGYYQVLAYHWMVEIVGIDPSKSVFLAEWEASGRDPSTKQDIELSLLTVVWRAISERLSQANTGHPATRAIPYGQASSTTHHDHESRTPLTGEIAKEMCP